MTLRVASMQKPEGVSQLVEHLFRRESAKMVATLTRIFGIEHLNLAEDVVQEALGRALQTWPYRGVPENPSAWIMRASRNLALDVIRREKVFRGKEAEIARLIEAGGSSASQSVSFSENEIADDRLRMMFVCCHPVVSRNELGSLRRMLVRLQRLLAPEPAAFFRLLNQPPDWIAGKELQNLQQAAEKFSTAITDTAALVERVKQLQEELSALVTAQANRTLFVLTVVTVLALPINLVAGLFGMNVGGIPLSQHKYGFLFVVSPLVVLTALLAYLAYWGLGRRRH